MRAAVVVMKVVPVATAAVVSVRHERGRMRSATRAEVAERCEQISPTVIAPGGTPDRHPPNPQHAAQTANDTHLAPLPFQVCKRRTKIETSAAVSK